MDDRSNRAERRRALRRWAMVAAVAMMGSPPAFAQFGGQRAEGAPFAASSAAPHGGTSQTVLPAGGLRPRPLAPVRIPAARSTAPKIGLPPTAAAAVPREQGAGLGSDAPGGESVAADRRTPPAPLVASVTVVRLLQRSEQLASDAELALRRGAYRTARESAIAALQTSAAAADLRSGQREAAVALEQALTAVREAGDLVGRYGDVGTPELQRMVQSHQTVVLHGCRLDALTPFAAADIYLDFARERLTRAAAGRREAAGMLVALSRAELAHRQQHGALTESVALTCLRAAVAIDPELPIASSELGYRAMQLGLLGEAQWALERSYQLQPTVPTLQKLIETHRLAGNSQAAAELVALLPRFAEPAASVPPVVQLDPSQFAAISPPVQPATGNPPRSVEPAGPQRAELQPSHAFPAAERAPQPVEAVPRGGAEQDKTVSVLERVAGNVRSLWK